MYKVEVTDRQPEVKLEVKNEQHSADKTQHALSDRAAALASLTTGAAVVEKLLITRYDADTIKNFDAKGKHDRELTPTAWFKQRVKAASEPMKNAQKYSTDPKKLKESQPYEVGAMLTEASGRKRLQNNVDAVTWCVLDFDGESDHSAAIEVDDAERLHDLLVEANITHLIEESTSSTPARRRFHCYLIIMPVPLLDADKQALPAKKKGPWLAAFYRPAYHIVATALRALAGIEARYDASSAGVPWSYFVPRCRDGAYPRWLRYHLGRGLDLFRAASALYRLGVDVPAAAMASPTRREKVNAQMAVKLGHTDDGYSGGMICLHSHAKRTVDLLAWAEEQNAPRPDVLPNRKRTPTGKYLPSKVPVGVTAYRVAKWAKESGLSTGTLGELSGPRRYEVICPFADEHGPDCRQRHGEHDSSTVIFLPDNVEPAAVDAYIDPEDTVDVLDADGKLVATTTATMTTTASALVTAEDVALDRAVSDIHRGLLLNSRGKLSGTPQNIVKILRHDPRWKGVLGWNELAFRVEKLAPMPVDPDMVDEAERLGPWVDLDGVRIAGWLLDHYEVEASADNCGVAAEIAAKGSRSFHPVKDYFAGLPAWDGKQRAETWLLVLGAKDSEYTRLIGKKSLVGAVARVYGAGCKLDETLVFEGGQGTYKSQSLAILFGGPGRQVCSDTVIDWNSKDKYIQIQGKWFYEIAELAGYAKAEVESIKAFLSSPVDGYRPPYGRGKVEVPRRVVFGATVNPGDDRGYLKDKTGNRRFYPVVVSRDGRDELLAMRDQIWAEAVVLYKAGFKWWLENAHQKRLCEIEVAERARSGDPWRETIEAQVAARYGREVTAALEDAALMHAQQTGMHLDEKPRQLPIDRAHLQLTAAGILADWFQIPISSQTGIHVSRVSAVMGELWLKAANPPQRFGTGVYRHYEHVAEKQRRRLLAVIFPWIEAMAPHPREFAVSADPDALYYFEGDLVATLAELRAPTSDAVSTSPLEVLRQWALCPEFPSKTPGGQVDRALARCRDVLVSLHDDVLAAVALPSGLAAS